MPGLLPNIDPDGLLEYSVVYTDRSLNHMSNSFQSVMNEVSASLKKVYSAAAVVLVPGGGTYAMEAVARQFATDKSCLVLRNGWFSYRWSQILEMGDIPSEQVVLKASKISDGSQAPFAPVDVNEVVNQIKSQKPAIVFAPHVETSAGIILPDDYIQTVAEAVHSVGGMFVLDCIASGAIWIDMEKLGVDILVSAPQKGWSASPSFGMVMLSPNASKKIHETQSTSYSCDLLKWLQIMQAYENGGHAYHATMPTDAIKHFRDTINETSEFGFDNARQKQQELGDKVRSLLSKYNFISVAADGFLAPGVVVSYTSDKEIHNGTKFKDMGMQIAAGVPLKCNEGDDYQTFRLGLFGLDKLKDVDAAVDRLEVAFKQLMA
ncbi:aminotransferase class V-fold PLP-dependent enzyme [Candidatus Thioglobus sp.]|nr:aminotransferase class V-fold PLP-dependent enzyme [Candidatus Thioglobus sp.]MDA8872063.1 aminotransferase class V-fold PLP-dependent enzyme [Candidatus Thioglobus sp.]